jgi:hypothetical protein
MIKIIKEIQPDWFLIHLEGTRNYQIWNKWQLFQCLLKETETDLNHPKPHINLLDEDFPMSETVLNVIVDELKKKI